MFDELSDAGRKLVTLARHEAVSWKHPYIGTEHLLLGLTRIRRGSAALALEAKDLDPESVREMVESRIEAGAQETLHGQLPFSASCKNVLEGAHAEALVLGHDYIGTGHLLLALLRLEDGIAAAVLRELDLRRDDVLELIRQRG